MNGALLSKVHIKASFDGNGVWLMTTAEGCQHLVRRRACAEPSAAPCLQMACTTKELREILQIAGPNLHVAPEVLQPSAADQAEMAAVRMKRRLHETLSKAAAQANPRQVVLYKTRVSMLFWILSSEDATITGMFRGMIIRL